MSAELAPRPAHRPSRLTPDTQDAICEGLRAGLTYELACQRAGLTYRAFRYWIADAERAEEAGDDSPDAARRVQFLHAVKLAEAECAARQLARIDAAARKPEHWTAAAWLVERRHPAYRQNVQHQHGGTVTHTLQLVDLAAVRPRADLPPGAGTWNGHAIETTAREAAPPEGPPPPAGDTGG